MAFVRLGGTDRLRGVDLRSASHRQVRVLLGAVVGAALLVVGLGAPADATTLQSTVLSPTNGRVTSSPDEAPAHHRPYNGDYSFDVATTGAAYANFRNTNGSLSLTVAAIGRACASGNFAHGGDRIVLNVLINGSKVGTVTYAHLTNFPITSGNVPIGARIGDAVTAAHGVVRSSCWTGSHVHVEPRNDVRYGCFAGGLLGTTANSATMLGLIGGERATGANQRCPAGVETGPPPGSTIQPGPLGSGDRLDAGQSLTKGRALTSDNGYYSLQMQSDGNLVLYRNSPWRALWASNTVGRGEFVTMQADGNLVVYGAAGAVWASGSGGGPGVLVVQNDGNLVVYAGGPARWASNTVQGPNEPFGAFDEVSTPSRLKVRVTGWAVDGDSPKGSIRVHVYGGATFLGELVADVARPDVAGVYPAFGDRHGFDGVLTTAAAGSQEICVYAINVGSGSNQRLGCKTATVTSVESPSQPLTVGAVGDHRAALVSWAASRSNGGSPVTQYQALATPGGKSCTTTGTGRRCIVSGLANGTTYTFKVRTRNAVGWSAWSTASRSVTPTPVRKSTSSRCSVSDLSRDGRVGINDLIILQADYGTAASRSDLNKDGTVNASDLSIMNSAWGLCTRSTPAPRALVKVSANAARSKLLVDVDPDKGSGYWTFRVDRLDAAGSWHPVKSYRTKGPKETRKINLPKGRYRVVVHPKYGLRGTVSTSVALVK